MERIPSVGVVEIILVVVAAGLVFLVGAAIVAVVVTRRRGGDSQAAALGEQEIAPPRSSRARGWLVVIVLLAVLAIPLCVVVGGVLWVTPVSRTVVGESGMHVVEQGQPIVTLSPAMIGPFGTPLPGAQSSEAARRASTPPGRSALLSLNPFNPVAFVMLFGLAGLVLLLGVAVVVAVGKGWKGTDEPSGAVQANGDFQTTGSRAEKLRPVLLALVLWISLSIFLVLDLVFQVSLYWQFVVMYAAFWLLVGALLATGRPLRDKLLILGMFVVVLGSVRFVDWNSRKSFLRDFHGLQEGMTVEEVDQIMNGYMKAYGGGPPQSQNEYEFGEQGEVVTGWVTYRHTNEGWGDSDWGVVTFDNGQVVRLQFLPD